MSNMMAGTGSRFVFSWLAGLVVVAGTACGNPASSDSVTEETTVFEMTLDEAGVWQYSPTAFEGYSGGPVLIRALDSDGNTMFEHESDDMASMWAGLTKEADDRMAQLKAATDDDTEEVEEIRRVP